MATTAKDLAEYMARTALGDRAAFAQLYQNTNAKLFGVTLRILRDRGEAEEALQEIFVKVWQRADRFRPDVASPISWLVAIARNHCLDKLRARRPTSDGIDAALEVPDGEPDPEQATINAGERNKIDNCLDQLEADKADAVRSAYLDGYAYQELADRFGVPINTMRTWLRRSLMKLKDCLTS